MQQSKTDSLIEALFGTTSGFIIQMTASYFFLHMIGITISGMQNFWFGIFMTVISIARGYFVRRVSQRYLSVTKDWIVKFLKTEVK